jgi:hypothetical protein
VPEPIASSAAGVETPMNTLRGHWCNGRADPDTTLALTNAGRYIKLPHQTITALMCRSLSQGTPLPG